MATNIPPHNLGEIIDASILLLNNPNIDDSKIKECVLGLFKSSMLASIISPKL
jgi:DNA gyrase subunit A